MLKFVAFSPDRQSQFFAMSKDTRLEFASTIRLAADSLNRGTAFWSAEDEELWPKVIKLSSASSSISVVNDENGRNADPLNRQI
jgi:hypothetical protein